MAEKNDSAKKRKNWLWVVSLIIFVLVAYWVGSYQAVQQPSAEVEVTEEVPAWAEDLLERVELLEIEDEQVQDAEDLPPESTPPAEPESQASEQQSVVCKKHGTIAWHADNKPDGEYAESPIGGLDEVCGVVGQVWWLNVYGVPQRAVFWIPPHTVVWAKEHLGGTGWYFSSSEDFDSNLAEQAQELLDRDGEMETFFISSLEDWKNIQIYSRHQN